MDSKIFDIKFLKGLIYIRVFVILFVLFIGFYFVGSEFTNPVLNNMKKSLADSVGLTDISQWNFDHLSIIAKPLIFIFLIQLLYLVLIGRKKYDWLMVLVILDFVLSIYAKKIPIAPIIVFILLLSENVKNYFQGVSKLVSDDNILDDFS